MTALNAWPRVTSLTPATAAFVFDAAADTAAATKSILVSNVMTSMFASITSPVLFASSDGINVDTTTGDDSDIDIITLNVTGAPKLWWDESTGDSYDPGAITVNGRVNIGGVATTNSVDPMVNVNRAVNDTGAGTGVNGHCFSDSSTITRTGGAVAYNSFDCRIIVSGTANYDHFASFQNAPNIGTSGTTTKLYGIYDNPTVTTGVVTTRYGVYVANVTGASGGSVVTNYGVYIAAQSGSTAGYSLYCAGTETAVIGILSINPGQGASGDLPAGCSIKTASSNLSLVPSGDVGVGDKVVIAAYGNSAFRSVFDTSNKAGTALPDANLVLGGGNVGVGTATYGTNAAKVLAISTGTPPASSPDTCVQLYSADDPAGDACLMILNEDDSTIKLYQGAAVVDSTDASSVILRLNELLAHLRLMGIIAT